MCLYMCSQQKSPEPDGSVTVNEEGKPTTICLENKYSVEMLCYICVLHESNTPVQALKSESLHCWGFRLISVTMCLCLSWSTDDWLQVSVKPPSFNVALCSFRVCSHRWGPSSYCHHPVCRHLHWSTHQISLQDRRSRRTGRNMDTNTLARKTLIWVTIFISMILVDVLHITPNKHI